LTNAQIFTYDGKKIDIRQPFQKMFYFYSKTRKEANVTFKTISCYLFLYHQQSLFLKTNYIYTGCFRF